MELKAFYEAVGGDLEAVKSRISKEELIRKFVVKFLDDPSFELLCNAYEQEQYPEAFRGAHSLKGVCFNLGFQRLGESASLLTECLRGKETAEQVDKEACEAILQQVKEEYQTLTDAIKQLD